MAGTTEAPEAGPSTNRIGLGKKDYAGSKSTLCVGCGHDLITARIIDSAFDLGLKPENVVKISGIGCSSKTPAYFMSRSFAFNSVHGRMPSVATGASLANRQLKVIGISGDGDTANIGMGQFIHLMRRNLNMVYIVENNGVYGLTKGQFSATADKGSKQKWGTVNTADPVDLCALAIEMGCGFVARLFAGNTKMMKQVLQAAMAHKGTALLDVISPCVTFNNHAGSTKSFPYVKDHEAALQDIGFVPVYDPTYQEMKEGEERVVSLGDGSKITLKALDNSHNPTDRIAALSMLARSRDDAKLLTGMIYVSPKAQPVYAETQQMVDAPLASLPAEVTRPPKTVLDKMMDSLS
ncbi:MAG: 2-oxoacid:ferredoxin oxidoreductase subunit beta [Planctomycetes bacterium]|nr:2-oxoacid:ferredoxin oxidoreductase subunit beta [Planctomycetota bacterium]